MSHQKDENLDFDYLNPVQDSDSYVYYSTESAFSHPYSAETTQTSYSHYSNYQSPFRKVDHQYSPVPRNMFSSEFESGSKGYSRTFSGNNLLTDNTGSGRCLRRLNSDIPSYCDFGTYNPFQGSPLEIANLSLVENRPTTDEQIQQTREPPYENELVHEEPTEMIQSKRTYKDALTFPTRSESPSNANEAVSKKITVENEIRKETYKEKLLSPKQETPASFSKATQPLIKPGLNNHRSQINTNPKRPLKINNNLATKNTAKGNTKSPREKNWHCLNESVRSVRSQTDFGGINKKNRLPFIDNHSFEQPPTDDETISPVEVRAKDLKKSERMKIKVREKDNEKSNRRQSKKHQPPSTSATLARAYFPKLARVCGWFCIWLYSLCADVIRMSYNLAWLGLQQCHTVLWEKSFVITEWITAQIRISRQYVTTNWLPSIREFFRFFQRKSSSDHESSTLGGLNANIPLPSTGEEAMHRLLACKGRDPYSILGVRRDCSDEDIRRYYKRQAVLVHPDKNRQRGAEEAFKILAHAFELVGQPERRSQYDQLVQEADEMESAWAELNELLSRLHAKMDEAANTIRCTNCAKRHRRVKTERPCYAARYCQECKIHHSAREGDLWAESRYMGFRSKYYACMESAVYDITEWANCQAGHLRHLQSNSHRVQYRIVPGQGQPSNGNGRKSS
ncbi:dnaJ homolog dnj-5 [Daphnia magna]|uniref:DnaJ subfamily C member n=2 Tax=Daphnia magna TaxID=35525 RepID=A0A0P6EPA4_9CRUS|nr:dnaJ homolog dnj-5 [Daphnia magna]XP_045026651.1 dnaJ homolog dnj-5 [Daphnia magna]XP_045026653.1 dnaJ homolog dnj-5 [Daphnia magna]XP_045026654.1 dnaJ homolog dnj-5 [Daphnia magna]KAK4023344.1 hypothetical protein OUZ56_008761 [Daphnia magna]KZS07109.1 putative DnaJ subfamily C member 14 [Daphnia magna]